MLFSQTSVSVCKVVNKNFYVVKNIFEKMSNSIAKLLALDKLATIFNIIKQNGGIRASLFKLYRQDELKDGKLVGEDQFGNKYFENPRYFYSRNRWVEYSDKYYMNYDGSQDPGRPKYKWMQESTENMSGTRGQYVPYSTTPEKIQPWTPKRKSSV